MGNFVGVPSVAAAVSSRSPLVKPASCGSLVQATSLRTMMGQATVT